MQLWRLHYLRSGSHLSKKPHASEDVCLQDMPGRQKICALIIVRVFNMYS